MPSPFPGMDPFLEDPKVWKQFQQQFVSGLYHILLPNLVDRYRARIGVRSYVVETPLFTSVLREPHEEQFIEVRERGDGQLVSLIDVVSPANKTTDVGREAYHATRKLILGQRAASLEVDLVTQGRPLLDFARDSLPEHDYTFTVTRAAAPGKFEIYTTTVQKRLPKFKLPLAADDRDAMLDLQDVFRRAYDLGAFQKHVDYGQPLAAAVKLADVNRTWIELMLKQCKLK
ncbi:DUF4058 family protein [Limnoglobus roseus]|uniref:DUF4058 domain-containing protein n=1 Tax=Limnoglobus roseus TaxID=2598579 RepID=A0A5C1A5J0_9BACT|nr:DUF4058 family protein [Limnoglobus roseus]QEL13296.1 hypothetical protein PX52LOC_00150 [Limnoglobus roseus]